MAQNTSTTVKRVALVIPINSGQAGGVQQFSAGLVQSLADIPTPDLEFVVITNPKDPDWIQPYVSDDMDIVPRGNESTADRLRKRALSTIRQIARPVLKRQRVTNSVRNLLAGEPDVPDAGGYFEELGADIVHFPTPNYERTDLPTIFNPHDHQHLHYPENFSERSVSHRNVVYRAGCEEADAVDVPSHFVRTDTIDNYDIDPNHVYAITRGPPTALYGGFSEGSAEEAQQRYNLPSRFVFYPAQTWPHKNHATLLRALARLRDERGLELSLVCTGRQVAAGWENIQRVVTEKDLDDQVSFLGFVDRDIIRALYRLSEFVVLPSHFEGGGFLPLEAWADNTPIACSNVSSLPEKVGDAALLFDPNSVREMATCLHKLHTDDELREQLQKRGQKRLEQFTWHGTGISYRALYRTVAGLNLNDKDRHALAMAQSEPNQSVTHR